MATKEFVISTPQVSVADGFVIGRIHWNLGDADITKVEAKIASGEATFNGKLVPKGDPELGWIASIPSGTFTESFPKPVWHLRAEDLRYLGDDTDVSEWYSFGAGNDGVIAKFEQTTADQRPVFKDDTGPGSLAGVEFDTGDDDILVQSAGTATLAYDSDFTAFVVLGDFNSGDDRPIIGTSDTTDLDWKSAWGHIAGDHRVRNDNDEEYDTGALDLGSDEIRCLVCQNNSTTASRLSEWVDGTALYANQSITIASSGGGWTFNAIGGVERDRGSGRVDRDLYSGSLSEIILFDTNLTTDQRECYEGMLAHRWGLTASLPLSHTYKVTNPYIGVGIDADSNFLNTLSHISLGTAYATCSAITNAIVDGTNLLLYLPSAQNPGAVTVQITYTVS